MATEQTKVQVTVELIDQITTNMNKIRSEMASQFDGMKGKVKETETAFTRMGSALKNEFVGSLKAVGVQLLAVASVTQIIRFFSEASKAAREQEIANVKLAQALGFTSQALLDQASALQKTTKYSDEEIQSAQTILASYTKNEAAVKRLIPAVLDLATATGQDLASAANIIARNIATDTGELGRYRIAIDGAAGSTQRIDSMIRGINEKFKGQAEVVGEAEGGFNKFTKSSSELMEKLGYAINTVFAPAFGKLAQLFDFIAAQLPAAEKQATPAMQAVVDEIKHIGEAIDFAKNKLNLNDEAVVKWKTFKGELVGMPIEETSKRITFLTAELERLKNTEKKRQAEASAGAGIEMQRAEQKKADEKRAKDHEQLLATLNSDDEAANAKQLKDYEDLQNKKAALDNYFGSIRLNTMEKQMQDIDKKQKEAAEIYAGDTDTLSEFTAAANEKKVELAKSAIETENQQKENAAQKEKRRVMQNRDMAMQSAQMFGDTLVALTNNEQASGKVKQGMAIAQATINTAVGITKAFELPAPFNFIQAALIGAMGAAQLATISAQKFATGGFPSGRNALVTVNEQGQEAILNANATSRLGRGAIDRLNAGGNLSNNVTVGGDTIIINGNADQATVTAIRQTRQDQLIELKRNLRTLKATGEWR